MTEQPDYKKPKAPKDSKYSLQELKQMEDFIRLVVKTRKVKTKADRQLFYKCFEYINGYKFKGGCPSCAFKRIIKTFDKFFKEHLDQPDEITQEENYIFELEMEIKKIEEKLEKVNNGETWNNWNGNEEWKKLEYERRFMKGRISKALKRIEKLKETYQEGANDAG